MAKKKGNLAESRARVEKTRSKIENTPFKTVSEMNRISEGLFFEQWNRFESARIFNELIDHERFSKVKKEFAEGVSCDYGSPQGELVRAFSDGVGIKIVLSENLFNVVKSSEHAESLIRATGDIFSKRYYESKGLSPATKSNSEVKKEK